ncbi:MAG: hypothetical protein A2632_01380 [Candidatus Pacebacteria bacterium RIFCSPHIGHO2_01_FULL_46_16]|nr:MAG: hypothetical protein A2632_01380 [Candidatus Pacebacteria bacterium RIFCSPHIGHO2_01_FULL_46_16]
MKQLLLLVVTAVTCLALFHLYLQPEFPYTHDGENHLARFANYKIALREGQFPPRFAPNLMNHYGYPVFNFNYPLANILSLPFSILGVSYETTFKLLVVASVLFGALGVWQLTKSFKASRVTRWLSVIFWLLQPFLVSTIYFRGNIGEVMAVSLLPWLIWSSFSLAPSRWLFRVIILTAFLLSHNISAVIGSGIYLALSLVCHYPSKQKLLTAVTTFVWAVALSLWFWLPAVLESSSVVVSATSLVENFSQHFVSLSQLLWSPLRFGFSYPGGVDSLSFALGLPAVLLVLVSPPLLFTSQRKTTIFPVLLLLVFAWLSILGQLSFSQPLWDAVPALRLLQFPWRLNLFTTALLLPSLVYILQRSQLITRLVLILLVMQVVVVARLSPADYFHKSNVDYDVFSQSTSTQNENRTKEFTYDQIADWQPTPTLFDPAAGTVTVRSWNGSARQYELVLRNQTTVLEPTMNFPGWETKIVQNGITRKATYVQSSEIAGRLAYVLSPGEYQVTSRFTQKTPSRLLGNTISLLAFGWLIFSAARKRYG